MLSHSGSEERLASGYGADTSHIDQSVPSTATPAGVWSSIDKGSVHSWTICYMSATGTATGTMSTSKAQ